MKTLFVLPFLLLGACTDPVKTTETLDKMGFTNIHPLGYSAWACGNDYTYATEFRATNPVGKEVRGTVCCGYFKGCSAKF